MGIATFLNRIKTSPETIGFNETIAIIDANYEFTPTAFKNGDVLNDEGKNSGSCKLFAFARLNGLTQQQTLYCFGDFYKDVLNTPEGNDHQNIRNFIKTGWEGIKYEGEALKLKKLHTDNAGY
jgi:hypothetical protein